MSPIERSKQTLRALALIKAGFRTSIIVSDTDLKPDYIRSLFKEVNGVPPKGGQLPEAQSITKTYHNLVEAFAFISTYITIVGEGIFEKLDMDKFICAHDLYLSLRNELNSHKPISWDSLNINDAWVLAKALPTGIITVRKCDNGCDYLNIEGQLTKQTCPICYLKRRKSFH